jgi:hypothetical protein
MSVHLIELDEDNFEERIDFRVWDDQLIVAPNVYLIGQAGISPPRVIKAIYRMRSWSDSRCIPWTLWPGSSASAAS